jgi:hypothetical protein
MEPAIIDLQSLLDDLRLSVRYAARVGVLKDRAIMQTLEVAEDAMANARRPDVFALTTALNEIAAAIAPMTIADLHFKRDPFRPESQRKSGMMQMALMLFSLSVLAIIGDYMHALQREQEALTSLEKIRELQPQQKLTELRRIAQWDDPLALPRASRTLNDQYHQKVAELLQINSTMVNTYSSAVTAVAIPLNPFQRLFYSPKEPMVLGPEAPASAISPAPGTATAATAAASSAASAGSQGNATLQLEIATTTKGSDSSLAGADGHAQALCGADAEGELRLPEESKSYPKWMKTALRDALNDFCFQLNVVSPGGFSALQSQSLSQLSFAGTIKEKISLRVVWFLPFLYGLLGSAIFVMRNIASVRTPSMEWLAIAMRISLGGVAGIVVGWFSSAASNFVPATSLISLPFALAFLTGYGIDALFNVLDRLNRLIADPASRKG